jgi:quinol monooxygenase YgiN
MQRVTLVRYTAKPNRAAENEALARAVFTELRAASPDHLAYALFRDGQDFVHLFVNTAADDSDALTDLPSFKAFAKDVEARCEAPPQVTRLGLRMLESYGLTRAMAPA